MQPLINTVTTLYDMLGDLIYEHVGKITGQRVLDAEGAKMETTFSGNAKYRSTDVQRLEHIAQSIDLKEYDMAKDKE